MIIDYETTGNIDALRRLIETVSGHSNVNGLMILCCDANRFTPDRIDPILKQTGLPIIGGIFPSIIHQESILEKGTIVAGLTDLVEAHTIEYLSEDGIDYEDILDEKIPDVGTGKSMIVFVDGFSKRISALMDSLFSVFGLEINYIGGGAGSLDMIQKPCLLTPDGLVEDCAVIALLDSVSGVGVNHGWTPLEGPYRVTRSDNNVIQELDWRPAFDVYHEAVTRHTDTQLSMDNFFDIAKAYPFGINRLDNEQVVRDPIQVNDDKSLVCVGEVPEGVFVSILNGNTESLISAAGKALEIGIDSFPKSDKTGSLFMIDCISRVLFLEDQFEKELKAAQHQSLPLIGACTLGEIADCGKKFLEFYNKTCVVAAFGK